MILKKYIVYVLYVRLLLKKFLYYLITILTGLQRIKSTRTGKSIANCAMTGTNANLGLWSMIIIDVVAGVVIDATTSWR